MNNLITKISKVVHNPSLILHLVEDAYDRRRCDNLMRRHFLENPEKANAVLLASYPKSGNTYLRFIFANLIALNAGGPSSIDFHALEKMLPTDFFDKDLVKPWPYRALPCILKSHKAYRPIFESLQSIFLYRNPLDTMVSGFFYDRSRVGPPSYASKRERKRMDQKPFTGTPGEYLRKNIPSWTEHYLSWRNRSTVRLSYESMKRQPVEAVALVLNRLGLKIEESLIRRAAELSSIARIRKFEDERGRSEKMAKLNGRFARSGSVGQWQTVFTKSDLDFFERWLASTPISRDEFEFILEDDDETLTRRPKKMAIEAV